MQLPCASITMVKQLRARLPVVMGQFPVKRKSIRSFSVLLRSYSRTRMHVWSDIVRHLRKYRSSIKWTFVIDFWVMEEPKKWLSHHGDGSLANKRVNLARFFLPAIAIDLSISLGNDYMLITFSQTRHEWGTCFIDIANLCHSFRLGRAIESDDSKITFLREIDSNIFHVAFHLFTLC